MVALAVMDEQIIELKDLRDSNEASIEGKSKQQVGIHSPGTLLFHQVCAGDRVACGFAFHMGQVKISSKNNGDESCRQRSRYYCCCC